MSRMPVSHAPVTYSEVCSTRLTCLTIFRERTRLLSLDLNPKNLVVNFQKKMNCKYRKDEHVTRLP
jgi:hypothetical protein